MRAKIIFIFLNVIVGVVNSQTLTTTLTKDSVFVGQPAIYQLDLELPSDLESSSIKWNIPRDSLSRGLEILSVKALTKKGSNSNIYSRQIKVSAEEIGYFPIQPISINFKENEIYSEAKLLQVYSTLKSLQNESLRDIKESTQIDYSFFDFLIDNILIITLSLVILIAIVIGILIIIRNRNKESKHLQEEILITPPSPIEIARQKLETLKTKRLWQNGNLKMHHSEISYIIREYLEGELQIPALESPTRDILKSLQKFHFSKEISSGIKTSLSLTDLVKFAKQEPTEQENLQVLEDAEKVISEIQKTNSSVEK